MSAAPHMLFVFPKCSGQRTFDGFDYHLGAAYIRAFLAVQGIETEQFIHDGSSTLEEVSRAILSVGADLVGFSVYDVSYPLVRMLARALKARKPDVTIICGGPSATFSGEGMLQDCEAIDLCVRGYAEQTCLHLVEWANGDRRLEDIPGLWFRQGTQLVRTDDVLFNATGMEEMPDPYLSGMIPPDRCGDIGVITSRGCSFPCSFCNCSAMSGHRVFFYSVPRVLRIFEFLNECLRAKSSRKTRVPIVDDHFSMQKERFLELLETFKERAFSHLDFWAEMRAERLEAGAFDALLAAGFREIHFGLESAVPEVLATLCKVRACGAESDGFALEYAHREHIRRAVQSAKAAGLAVSISVIFGAPGETEAMGLDTLRFVEGLNVDRYAHNYLRILPGTPLAHSADLQGVQVYANKHTCLPWITTYAYDVFRLPILHNDNAHFFLTAEDRENAFRLLSGVHVVMERGDGNSALSSEARTLMGVARADVHDEAFLKCARAIPMNASVWILHGDTLDRGRHIAEWQQAGIPVHECSTLFVGKEGDAPERWRINELSPSAPDENVFTVEPGPFACVVTEPVSPAHTWEERKGRALSLSSSADLETLCALASELKQKGQIEVGRYFSSCRTCVIDECRWCARPCPAGCADRLFFDNRGLRPCFTKDEQLCMAPTDSIDLWQEWIQEKKREIAIQRGCERCSARERCAQCLFLGGVSERDYCALQRGYPEAGAVIGAMGVLRALAREPALMGTLGDATLIAMKNAEGIVFCRQGRRYAVSDSYAVLFRNVPFAYLFFSASNELFQLTAVERFLFLNDCL